jgi:sRNA-binding regulator protein Hfq
MSSSMLYTIGTALNHARDNGLEVSLLVEGQWVSGLVAAVDGFGVLLATEGDHAVVRVEAVSAVRIAGAVPHRTEIPAAAHPMPGPQAGARN